MTQPKGPIWPAVLLVDSATEIPEAPLVSMANALASCLAERFGDAVLRVDLSVEAGEEIHHDGEPVHALSLPVPAGPGAPERIASALNRWAPRYAYTVVVATAPRPIQERPDELARALEPMLLPSLGRRLIRLHRDPDATHERALVAALPRWRILSTLVLDREPRRFSRRKILQGASMMGMRVGSREAQSSGHPSFEEVKGEAELVRVRMERRGQVQQESLGRWARAVSDRRVGLALGGSGAWGFAHAALIWKMENAGIPIDVIASSSSGSLVGAYYSADGRNGIKRLLDDPWRIDLVVLAALVSMTPFELFVDWQTGGRELTDLDVLFYPVTTNLTRMRPERVQRAGLAWGVRASSSAPGIFAPTTTLDAVYVDGAVSRNVPAELVDWLGADLVVAMNPLPEPKGMLPRQPGLGLDALLMRIPPAFRIRTFRTSLALVFHEVGSREAKGYITYEPPREAYPLLGTGSFFRGRRIFETVQKQVEFRETFEQLSARWDELKRPRPDPQHRFASNAPPNGGGATPGPGGDRVDARPTAPSIGGTSA